MITNLLDTVVTFDEVTGKICAVYSGKNHSVLLGIAGSNGKLYFDVHPNDVTVGNKNCAFYLYWYPDKKIWCIKLVREILGLGLREAKDLVEKWPNGVPIECNKEDALKYKILAETNRLECKIV